MKQKDFVSFINYSLFAFCIGILVDEPKSMHLVVKLVNDVM